MKIAIIGAGMTGAYLYRLLSMKGQTHDLYDKKPETRCGISPCAWGTSRGFQELVTASGLDPATYIFRSLDYVLIDGVRIKADLMTFDKPRLIRDLLQGAKVNTSSPDRQSYDRIIDSTGVSRACLPAIPDDLVLPCLQVRLEMEAGLDNRITLGPIGYAWSFPLSGRQYHVGCGSLKADPLKILEGLGWMKNTSQPAKKLCACAAKIRLTSPHYSLPFFHFDKGPEVWGVGEAIGCVAPLAGDGIVPGMKSVQILMDQWDNPAGYTKAILREFAWMKNERGVIDKLRKNMELGLKDAWVLKKNSRRMGMQVGLKEAVKLLKHLR